MLSAIAGLPLLPGEPYALDGHVPTGALRPESADALASALGEAQRAGLAVVPWGGGTHQGLGNAPTRYDLALVTTGLDRLRDFQPADMVVTVEAGMTLSGLPAHLAPAGQFVPLEAEAPDRATIGGLIAAGVSGPLRFGYGTARDCTLWIEAALPDGRLAHGGAKVVKSVAGYDTPKLFWGSIGTAGVLTAVCFKTSPLPESSRTVLLGFGEADFAQATLAELSSGRLAPSLVTLTWGDPSWRAAYSRAPWVLAIGADGPTETTDWQVAAFVDLKAQGKALSACVLDGEDSRAFRRGLMSQRARGTIALRLSLMPSQVPYVLGHLDRRGALEFLRVSAEAGNGVVRIAGDVPGDWWREAAALASELGGTWVLERCPADWKRAGQDVWGAARGDRALMQRLKQSIDPQGTLAPGRFVGG